MVVKSNIILSQVDPEDFDAPVVLARARVLKDRKATVYHTVADEITKCSAHYTGSGSHAAKDFATAILNTLRLE